MPSTHADKPALSAFSRWMSRLAYHMPTLIVLAFFSYLGLVGEMTRRANNWGFKVRDYEQQWEYGWPRVYRAQYWGESPQGLVDRGGVVYPTELLIDLAAVIAITTISACLVALRRRYVRRGQLRLVELLLLFAVVGLFAAWWRKHAVHAERAATLDARYLSVASTYDDFFGPQWLARLCGRDNLGHFVDIWRVELDGEKAPSELSSVVDELREYGCLSQIGCNSGAPAVLSEISRLTTVTEIDLLSTESLEIADSEVLQLRVMPNLRQITVYNGKITPDAIREMAQCGISVVNVN